MILQRSVGIKEVLEQYGRLRTVEGSAYEEALGNLWSALQHRYQDDAVGAHLGTQVTPSDIPHASVFLSSPTLRDALRRVFAFANAANPHQFFALERRGPRTLIGIRHDRPFGTVRQDTEMWLALFSSVVRLFDPQNRPPVEVHLRIEKPPCDAELRAAFGCPLAYSQPEDAVLFDDCVLNTPIWGSDSAALALQDLLIPRSGPLIPPAGWIERVAAAIRKGLPQGHCGEKNIADELKVSPRTLERRLADSLTSYREILEDVRFDRSLELLQIPELAPADLARQLGYSNPSNFRRAFCGWFAPRANSQTAGNRPSQPDPAGAKQPFAPTSDTPAETNRWRGHELDQASSRKDLWITVYGPRPCPFTSAKCGSSCAIHPDAWKVEPGIGEPHREQGSRVLGDLGAGSYPAGICAAETRSAPAAAVQAGAR